MLSECRVAVAVSEDFSLVNQKKHLGKPGSCGSTPGGFENVENC